MLFQSPSPQSTWHGRMNELLTLCGFDHLKSKFQSLIFWLLWPTKGILSLELLTARNSFCWPSGITNLEIAYMFHYFLNPTSHLYTIYEAVIFNLSKPPCLPVQNRNNNRVYLQECFEGLTYKALNSENKRGLLLASLLSLLPGACVSPGSDSLAARAYKALAERPGCPPPRKRPWLGAASLIS